MKLKDRILSYEERDNYKLLPKVPVIININGRGFSKVTSLLDKPFCKKFADAMYSSLLKVCMEAEGSVFGYYFNDDITIVTRNDQNIDTIPWYDNKIQKIASIASSIVTYNFSNCVNAADLTISGDCIFTTSTFNVPNFTEAINTIIYKQQTAFQTSLNQACFYYLLEKFDKNQIKEMLSGLNADDKIELLKQEVNINYNNLPSSFRKGVACYRSPKMYEDGSIKNKWVINTDLPIFTQDQLFLNNIFYNGADVLREDNF